MIQRPIVYEAYRKAAVTGDLLLCHASSIESRIICDVTHATYSHAAMAGWAGADALMLAETRQHADARLISLSGEIARWPGYYDVYRVRRFSEWSQFDPAIAWSFMCHAAGAGYGWNHLARVWARRTFGWIKPIPNSDEPQWPRDCSALIHAALRAAGGLQLREFDCDVVPGDLADPYYFEYRYTLYFEREHAEAMQAEADSAAALNASLLDAEENGAEAA